MDVQDKIIQINELLSYWIEKENVYVQIVPEKEVKNVMDRFMEGLHELAGTVQANENIKKISINSWVVAVYPMVLERFGFEIEGEVSTEIKKKYFSREQKPVWGACMDRDEFLNRYLN